VCAVHRWRRGAAALRRGARSDAEHPFHAFLPTPPLGAATLADARGAINVAVD
jgi:hypothetical protein